MLPAEAAEREVVVGRLAETFSAWGYVPVETPAVELMAALESGAGSLEGTAFRLLDLDGSLLALRPDLTVPIARLVASRLAEERGPLRLRYAADVFREHESLRGQARQFTQVGIEMVDASGPAADAEVIALLVTALREAGLAELTVAVGSVEVFSAIVEAADMPREWQDEVVAAAHDNNLVALDRLAGLDGVSAPAARALSAVPRISGGLEALDACREAAAGCGCDAALDALGETFALLGAAGVAPSVRLDFGVMRSFDYYSGIVIEAYAPGIGLPVGGGGRYDGVLGRFGAPRAAAGFALGLERLLIALIEQGVRLAPRRLDAVIGGDAAEALSAAARLRGAGWRVSMSERTGRELVAEAERTDAVEALLARGDEIVRLDRAGEPALPLAAELPEPPTSSWAERGDPR